MSEGIRAEGSDRIVVVGGGPCGLACAAELDRLGHRDWVLLEAAAAPGGLASSVTDPAGFTWDLGGHVVFSHFGEFDRLLDGLFGEGELLRHDRSSYIRFRDRWVPYPFQQHLHHLGPGDAEPCLRDLLAAARQPESTDAGTDFAAWLRGRYGDALVERFFLPYNAKVWATAPQEMGSSWVAERVAPVDPGQVLAALRGEVREESRWGPNATFGFPARGGTGEIWRRLAVRLGSRLRMASRVVTVDVASRTVSLAGGDRIAYGRLVATGPLDQLAAMTVSVPASVKAAAEKLRHNSVAMVGLGYRTPTRDARSWLYFPESDVPFYRATNFSKYAAANVPEADVGAYSAWMTETALPGAQFDEPTLVRSCDEAVRWHGLVPAGTELVSAHVEVIPYAYPVPTLSRDAALAEVMPWFEAHGVYPRGRFGTWRYEIGNMDHAVKMGVDIARRLVSGTPEELLSSMALPVPASGSRS